MCVLLWQLKTWYTVRIKKSLHFSKVPPYTYFNIFSGNFIHVGSYMSLLSNDTKKSDDIVCLGEQEPHFVKLTKSRLDRNWYLFCLLSATFRVVKRLRNYNFDGSNDNSWKNMLCWVYILTYATDILCRIELSITLFSVLVTFWCFTALIITSVITEHTKKLPKRSIK